MYLGSLTVARINNDDLAWEIMNRARRNKKVCELHSGLGEGIEEKL